MEDHTAIVSVYSSHPHAFGAVVVEAFQHLAKEISAGVSKMSERDRLNLERQKREAAQRDLAKALDGVIGAISAAMETRDPYTAGHQRRVAEIASAIAREMKWQENHVEALRLAALVHDIGKIAIPAEILTRPTGLREAEVLLMKEHPETGYQILKDIPFDSPVAEMVRQHHERMDGTGYPRGLKGDEIIIGARILAVADVLEATASPRPSRAARGFEAAIAEIERQAGTQFDVDAVRTCVSLCRAGKLNLS
jgi:putative nucleotidyltransferase with HDIG domain